MAAGEPRDHGAGEPGAGTPPAGAVPQVGSSGPPAAPVLVALGIVYVVWGSTYLGIGITVESMPPLSSAGARFLTAAVVMGLAIAVRSGVRHLRVRPRELGSAALIGLLLPAGGNGLVSVAEDHGTPTGVAALVIASVPLYVVLYRAATGDRPAPLTVGGVLIGFAGLAMLVAVEGPGGAVPVLPTLVVVFAAGCWSLGSFVSPRISLPVDPFVASVYEMAAGGLVMLAGGAAVGERWAPGEWTTRSMLAWGYLVVFGSLVAFTSYVWVLGRARISLVATYAYVNPVVAIGLGWLVLGEPVTAAIASCAVVVVAGVALVVGAESRRADTG